MKCHRRVLQVALDNSPAFLCAQTSLNEHRNSAAFSVLSGDAIMLISRDAKRTARYGRKVRLLEVANLRRALLEEMSQGKLFGLAQPLEVPLRTARDGPRIALNITTA